MLQRLLIGIIGVPLVFAVALWFPHVVMSVAIMLICAIAAFELMNAAGLGKRRLLLVVSVGLACAVPLWADAEGSFASLLLILIIALSALFIAGFFDTAITFAGICGAFFAGFAPAMALSSLLSISHLPQGRILFLMPFAVSWLCDAFAYFGGSLLGKHKLAPKLSPKKTIEGAISGLAGAFVGMTVFGIILGGVTGQEVDYLRIFVAALLGGIASQFGDLVFSYIKRQCGIKDFGTVLPGHGGILDRFDSLIFTAPLILYFLSGASFLVG